MGDPSLFARELRRARENLKLTQKEAADLLNVSVSQLEKVERGVIPPGLPLAKIADQRLRDGIETDAYFTRIREDGLRQPPVPDWFQWWRETVEPQATLIRVFAPLLVPGLLQIDGYARALLVDEGRVAARLERRQVFDKERPPDFVTIIDESVLHRLIGAPEVMYEQLQHLAAPPGAARVHILPAGAGTYIGLDGSLEIATLDGAEQLYLDTPIRGYMLDTRPAVADAERRWNALSAEALPFRLSRELILKVAERWNNESG